MMQHMTESAWAELTPQERARLRAEGVQIERKPQPTGPVCTTCRSSDILSERKNWRVGAAIVGHLLAPGIGAMNGYQPRLVHTCRSCGSTWEQPVATKA